MGLVVRDIVELERVGVLASRDDAEPLAHEVLLEEPARTERVSRAFRDSTSFLCSQSLLLGQVLDVTLGHGLLSGDRKSAGGLASDLDVLSELSSLALDLDVVHQELLVGGAVELRWDSEGQRSARFRPLRRSIPRAEKPARLTILSLAGPVKSTV